MAKSTDITVTESKQLLLSPAYQAIKQFECQQKMAEMYVTSTIVPDTYRGNIGNCIIAIDMAQRMRANPLMVMQNLYIVHGNPAWSSKFLISCINCSGRFTPLRYQFYGKRGTDQYGCRAYAYERDDKEHKDALSGTWVTIEMAKREGWFTKNGSKWMTMADQMLIYRAAAFWARAYAPEISMGILTKEEVEDAIVIDEVPMTAPEVGDIPEPPITDAPVEEPAEAKEEPSTTTEQPSATTTGQSASMTAQQLHEAWKRRNAADVIGDAMRKQTMQAQEESVDNETGEIKFK